jgi:hypothetical protein
MAVQENQQLPWSGALERRAYPRHRVDCAAVISPVSGSVKMPGRLIELSLSGCRVITDQRFLAGIMVRVEVQFQLQGILFRIVGVTVSGREARSIAIRFLDLTQRRREELADVIAEVAESNAAKAAAAAAQAETASPDLASGSPETPTPNPETKPVSIPASLPPVSMNSIHAVPEEATPAASALEPAKPRLHLDRRSHGRHAVDTSARLLLVKSAISMPGRILNLSLGGCRIRTDERFQVGIFVRIEAEFYLHGLPFRVAGVSQAILDRNTIGIRFLDLSDRRREQLTELIAEIAEAEQYYASAGEVAMAENQENPPANR